MICSLMTEELIYNTTCCLFCLHVRWVDGFNVFNTYKSNGFYLNPFCKLHVFRSFHFIHIFKFTSKKLHIVSFLENNFSSVVMSLRFLTLVVFSFRLDYFGQWCFHFTRLLQGLSFGSADNPSRTLVFYFISFSSLLFSSFETALFFSFFCCCSSASYAKCLCNTFPVSSLSQCKHLKLRFPHERCLPCFEAEVFSTGSSLSWTLFSGIGIAGRLPKTHGLLLPRPFFRPS